MPDQFAQPIPGQSLTDIPRNAPWERPPEMVEPAKITEYYIKKLSDDELLQDLGLVFELGGDLRSTTEALMLIGVQQGLHTVEAGMIVAPIVGTYIKVVMNDMGINPKETNRDLDQESTDRENNRIKILIKEAIDKDEGESSGVLEEMQGAAEPDMEMPEPQEDVMAEEVETEAEPMGLMSRGTE